MKLAVLILPDNVSLDDKVGKVPVMSKQADLTHVEGGDSFPKTVHICYLNIFKHGINTKIDKS